MEYITAYQYFFSRETEEGVHTATTIPRIGFQGRFPGTTIDFGVTNPRFGADLLFTAAKTKARALPADEGTGWQRHHPNQCGDPTAPGSSWGAGTSNGTPRTSWAEMVSWHFADSQC